MRKKRKLYVVIALLAVAGLVITSFSGALAGLFAGSNPLPGEEAGIEDYLDYFQGEVDGLLDDLEKDPLDLEKWETLADLYSEMGILYYYMGDSLNSMLKFAESHTAYETALELNPDSLDLAIKTAAAAQYAGNYQQAEDMYKELLAKDPGYPIAYVYYGILLYSMMDLEGAIQQFEAALALEEDFDPEEYPLVSPDIFATAAGFLEDARTLLAAGEHVHDENCDHEDDEECDLDHEHDEDCDHD